MDSAMISPPIGPHYAVEHTPAGTSLYLTRDGTLVCAVKFLFEHDGERGPVFRLPAEERWAIRQRLVQLAEDWSQR